MLSLLVVVNNFFFLFYWINLDNLNWNPRGKKPLGFFITTVFNMLHLLESFEYSQLCQRYDGTIYGIPSGKRCLNGRPVTSRPEKYRSQSNKELVRKARELGLSEEQIKQAQDRSIASGNFEREITIALQLNASKRKELREEIQTRFTKDPLTGFVVPKDKLNKEVDEEDPGVQVKRGQIGKDEALSLEIMKGSSESPELIGIEFLARLKKDPFENAEGILYTSKVKGQTLEEFFNSSDFNLELVQNSYYNLRKTLHVNGISHNDLNPNNIIVKPDYKLAVGNFGKSQVGHKRAFVEAMGVDGTDPYFKKLHSKGLLCFSESNCQIKNNRSFDSNNNSYKRLMSNRERVGSMLKRNHNVDFGEIMSGNTLGIKSRRYSAINNLSDKQVYELIKDLYEGVFSDFVGLILGFLM